MLTTELKKSGSNDVVVQGKLIINISSNIGTQSANTNSNGNGNANHTALQAGPSHQRTPSVISAVSSNATTNPRNSSIYPGNVSTTPTPTTAASASPAAATTNGGRQMTPYEDQHGPLPPK